MSGVRILSRFAHLFFATAVAEHLLKGAYVIHLKRCGDDGGGVARVLGEPRSKRQATQDVPYGRTNPKLYSKPAIPLFVDYVRPAVYREFHHLAAVIQVPLSKRDDSVIRSTEGDDLEHFVPENLQVGQAMAGIFKESLESAFDLLES
jgi:hypothetical protein